MKNAYLLLAIFLFFTCNSNKQKQNDSEAAQISKFGIKKKFGINSSCPFKGVWMGIEEVDNSYVVYDYPSLLDNGESKSPEKIKVEEDQHGFFHVTHYHFSGQRSTFVYDSFNLQEDSTYFFAGEYSFRFRWVDKDKHIAQWIIYEGLDRYTSYDFYIDSLYNTFPIVTFEWD